MNTLDTMMVLHHDFVQVFITLSLDKLLFVFNTFDCWVVGDLFSGLGSLFLSILCNFSTLTRPEMPGNNSVCSNGVKPHSRDE